MADTSIGTEDQLRDPNYTPPLAKAIPLGIQHVLAMFVSNVTPAIIISGAAGFGFGSNSPDFPQMIYMIQMSMFFAGLATLIQTIGIGPVGARLPIVQGTSFAFIPIMIPLVATRRELELLCVSPRLQLQRRLSQEILQALERDEGLSDYSDGLRKALEGVLDELEEGEGGEGVGD